MIQKRKPSLLAAAVRERGSKHKVDGSFSHCAFVAGGSGQGWQAARTGLWELGGGQRDVSFFTVSHAKNLRVCVDNEHKCCAAVEAVCDLIVGYVFNMAPVSP